MKNMNKLLYSVTAIVLCWMGFSSVTWSAVKPLYTRVVANSTAKETSVDIINEAKTAYMVQSWLEDINGNDKNIPVVLTPPVMKLEAERQGKIRLVVMPGQIAQDRESVYWLNIQEIPPKAKADGKNMLTVAVRSKIKVFVRPESIVKRQEETVTLAEKLSLGYEKDGRKVWLLIKNPTPFYASFGELTVKSGGQKASDVSERFTMSAPFSTQRYSIPASYIGKKVTVTWRTINDYGGTSNAMTKELQL